MLPPSLSFIATMVRTWNRRRLTRRSKLHGKAGNIKKLPPYTAWHSCHDVINDELRAKLNAQLHRMMYRPAIAVVMPVFNANLAWLQQAIESVRQQIYPHWQLCIADDASTDEAVRAYLRDLSFTDERIRVTFRPINGHISEATNSALALVDAPYVGFLDQDDVLREHALLFMAKAIERAPGVRLLYSDEDKIDESGVRSDPHFKPAWNPELLLAQNYVCHFTVMETALVRTHGGLRKGMEGAQDHDLLLRCSQTLDPTSIVHVPFILYHWRKHPESTALNEGGSKAYAGAARLSAIEERLSNDGTQAQVRLGADGWARIRWALPSPAPLVTIIVQAAHASTYEAIDTDRCVESILSKTSYPRYEIIILGSGTEHVRRTGAKSDKVKVDHAASLDDATAKGRGEFFALLEDDLEVLSPEWLSTMVAIAARKGTAIVGPDIRDFSRSDHLRRLFRLDRRAPKSYLGRDRLTQQVHRLDGGCLVMAKSVYASFHPSDGKAQLEDRCPKAAAQELRHVWAAQARLLRRPGTRHASPQPRVKWLWGAALLWDPLYTDNLVVEDPNLPDVLMPPRGRIQTWGETLTADISPQIDHRTSSEPVRNSGSTPD